MYPETWGAPLPKFRGRHKWNKLGSFGWRNIINGLGQAFLQDFGRRVVRPKREREYNSCKKYRMGSAKFICWSQNQVI